MREADVQPGVGDAPSKSTKTHRSGLIIGVTGSARTGKDTFAEYLRMKHGFVRIGLADLMKRICKEVFDFTDAQLYGDERDKPDKRYPRILKDEEIPPDGTTEEYLTPRLALQRLGTEWGRYCYDDIWIEHGVRAALKLLEDPHLTYDVEHGLRPVSTLYQVKRAPGVIFSDIRFRNEFDVVKKAGGIMVRIYRQGHDGAVGIPGHASETEQKQILDDELDYVLHNPDGLENYYRLIDETFASLLEGV